MSNNLFKGFDSVTKTEFIEKIVKDLKGKDYDESLLWSAENQVIQPFYHAEDLKSLIDDYNGNWAQSSENSEGRNWAILEKVIVTDAREANKMALKALMKGTEAIEFDIQKRELTQEIYNQLVEGIVLDIATISFTNYTLSELSEYSNLVHLEQDSITYSLAANETFDSKKWIAHLMSKQSVNLTVNTAPYQNVGATIVDQLAFGLGILNEYLSILDESSKINISRCKFKFAVGSNFFFEVGKLRAAKMLIKVLLKQYNLESLPIYIEVESTGINKSRLDEYTNMLRNTSECMSAIIGGANSVVINAHDYLTKPTENGQRWARNISHILRKESYFDKVNDPTKGSYYVEALTDQIANEAWEVFKKIEQENGFLEAVNKGVIQDRITTQVDKLKAAIADKSTILVGVNKYIDSAQSEKEAVSAEGLVASFLTPIRLAEAHED